MGWGDIAKAALDKAVAAIEASAIVTERLGSVLEKVREMESRVISRQEDFERRLRELESRTSKVEGKVEAGFSTAMESVLQDRLRDGRPPNGDGRPLGPVDRDAHAR